ncbi:MAG TPA: VOC family protein [Actinomycetota bacterium]|nr:VOC family protein [Actinomycetota bacterium]
MPNSPAAQLAPRSIAAATGVGAVHLAVTDPKTALSFYRNILGLDLLDDGPEIRLGAGGRELVVLHPGAAEAVSQGRTGLYHLAIVVPDRREFARVVRRLTEVRYPHAPTDHTLTKADYLWDPDGNGIEIYVETPEDGTWIMNEDEFAARDASGRLRSGRDPINLHQLFAELTPDDDVFLPLPAGSKMGHVHLHVRDVDEAVGFYSDLIGFDVMGRSRRMGAAFVSAGGYHHHLGLNTWAGKGAPPPPADAAGLRRFTIEVPDESELDEVVSRLDHGGVGIADSPEGGVLAEDGSGNRSLITVRKEGDNS